MPLANRNGTEIVKRYHLVESAGSNRGSNGKCHES